MATTYSLKWIEQQEIGADGSKLTEDMLPIIITLSGCGMPVRQEVMSELPFIITGIPPCDNLKIAYTDSDGCMGSDELPIGGGVTEINAPEILRSINCDDLMPVALFNQALEAAIFDANPDISAIAGETTYLGNPNKPIKIIEVLAASYGELTSQAEDGDRQSWHYELQDLSAALEEFAYKIEYQGIVKLGIYRLSINTENCQQEDNCDQDFALGICESGNARFTYMIKHLDQQPTDQLSASEDTLTPIPEITTDGSQNPLAEIEWELFDKSDGGIVLDETTFKSRFAAVGDFVEAKYRAKASCSGQVSEWKIMKMARTEIQASNTSGYSINVRTLNGETTSSMIAIDAYVKLITPEDFGGTVNQVVLSPDTGIILANPDGSPANDGEAVILNLQTNIAKIISSNSGAISANIDIEGCPTMQIPSVFL